MKTVIVPVESTDRELDIRLLLCGSVGELLDADARFYIGHSVSLRQLLLLMKNFVYFGKHVFGAPRFSDAARVYDKIKKRNGVVIHLNEEGGIWPGQEKDWLGDLERAEKPSVMQSEDLLLEWGDYQTDFYKNFEPSSVPIITSGHPRFDLNKEKYRWLLANNIREISQAHGDFILVNTTTSWGNNALGQESHIFKETLNYNPNSVEDRIFRFKNWSHQKKVLAEVIKLVNEISLEYPDKKIIIRPHPAEDVTIYKSVFCNIENIEVILEGSPGPWIAASELFIHTGSSTALEAHFLNVPTVYFRPHDSDMEILLASEVGKICQSAKQVFEVIERPELGQVARTSETSRSLLMNFDFDSIQKTTELLVQKMNEVGSGRAVGWIVFKSFMVFHWFYLLLKRFYFSISGQSTRWNDFKQRFRPFDKKTISETLALVGKQYGVKLELVKFSKYVLEVRVSKDG